MHPYQISERGQPLQKASKALILIHGRGSTAVDILRLGAQLADEDTYLAAPQAANGTWYPYSFMAEISENEPWLSSAIDIIKRLIDETAAHIPPDQIALAGFSQGACLSLEVAARFPKRYKAILAFTGGLIGKTISKDKYQGDFERCPIFIGTSDPDPHVPLIRCQESAQILEHLNAQVTLKVYPNLGHTINQAEIEIGKSIFR